MFASRSSCTHPHPRLGTSPPSRSTYPRSAPRAVLSDPAVPCAGHPLPRPRIPVSALILRPRIRVSALILGPRIRVSAQTHPSLCTDTDRRPCTRQASSLCQHSAMRVCARSLRTESASSRHASESRQRAPSPPAAPSPRIAGPIPQATPRWRCAAYGGLWRPVVPVAGLWRPMAANCSLSRPFACCRQCWSVAVQCSILQPSAGNSGPLQPVAAS